MRRTHFLDGNSPSLGGCSLFTTLGAGGGDSPAACPAGCVELSPPPGQSQVPKHQNNQCSRCAKLLQQGWQQQFLNTAQGRWVGGSREGKGVLRWPSELKVWAIFIFLRFFFFDVDYFESLLNLLQYCFCFVFLVLDLSSLISN